MNIFLAILLIAAMIATVAALVRGIVVFLKTSTEDVRGEGPGPSASALKQNKMMQYRILFQTLAVLIAALLLFAFGRA
ncbi:twin transmembrane helix small protein [Sphingomonas sp.]|uniref:twin transmembrane helix small protein n=1 Tax=Sphingomonas sp. TaxID=28214 RepID=UPI002B53483D|nr:twin transmembrane helix small protein [Sphingomonas sp.]HWK36878.1 twin transmembrane helix small protein [Sphingomonas sp.]